MAGAEGSDGFHGSDDSSDDSFDDTDTEVVPRRSASVVPPSDESDETDETDGRTLIVWRGVGPDGGGEDTLLTRRSRSNHAAVDADADADADDTATARRPEPSIVDRVAAGRDLLPATPAPTAAVVAAVPHYRARRVPEPAVGPLAGPPPRTAAVSGPAHRPATGAVDGAGLDRARRRAGRRRLGVVVAAAVAAATLSAIALTALVAGI